MVIDSINTPMANMVVYLTPINEDYKQQQLKMPVKKPVEVHQENKQFSPYITVMQKGYQLKFVNDDDITHHIYSASGPKRFSFKLRKDSSQKDLVFDQAGHISMGCNIHDWMSGHVLVVDTPFFGVTNNLGMVEFNSIPEVQYRLDIWHPQLQTNNNTYSQTVTTPLLETLTIQVNASMDEIPTQQSLDDFEFLEGY
ncbi:hypothetical protein LMH66_01510 [Shewanella sp. 10N.7]|uniref:hypothetical protein n=1 Tax=Shewanella sp. 10N.7 TaxID=2885093 RepID=UPI001E2E085C|nr:hypothetical protein [Shewanella sp. 10N.7]MCC4831306.1 hypothetical protein [Shewanella sp. 10N.7]